MSLVPVDVSAAAEARLAELDDDAAMAVLTALNTLANVSTMEKERKTILNDRYDIYVIEPDPAPPYLVVLSDPNEPGVFLADITSYCPNPTQAANLAATAAGIVVRDIHPRDGGPE